jgi:hypothetical protein
VKFASFRETGQDEAAAPLPVTPPCADNAHYVKLESWTALLPAASLADALAGAPAADDALRRWSDAQLQAAAQVIPSAEGIERSYVFDIPDLTAMPTTAASDWMSAAYAGLPVTLPGA